MFQDTWQSQCKGEGVCFGLRFQKVWLTGEGKRAQNNSHGSKAQCSDLLTVCPQTRKQRGERARGTLLVSYPSHLIKVLKAWMWQNKPQTKYSKQEPVEDIREWNHGIPSMAPKGSWLAHKEKCTQSNFRSSMGLETNHCSEVQTLFWGSRPIFRCEPVLKMF